MKDLLEKNDQFIIEHAVGRLCNTLRIFGEETLRLNSLLAIDQEEAVNNHDRSFESILENFHTLYDISKKYFNFFDFADTALLILLRNAIHHRNHNLFKSWTAQLALENGFKKFYGDNFLLCSYKPVDENSFVMEYYYKLEDILDRLDSKRNSPYLDTFLHPENRQKQINLLDSQLGFFKIIQHSQEENYKFSHIYINILPILNSALKKIFERLLSLGIQPRGFDDRVYLKHFTTEGFFDFNEVVFNNIKIIKSL